MVAIVTTMVKLDDVDEQTTDCSVWRSWWYFPWSSMNEKWYLLGK